METVSRCTPNAHLVVIGNGMASHRLVETLLRHPARPARITVIGEEPVPAYNRILLSPRLAGELEQQALTLQDPEALARQGVTLRLGQRVAQIDRQRQRVITHSGDALSYDRLVIATGSRSAMPDLPGVALRGVHGFRTLEDVATLEAIAQRGGHVVVV
ncbi:FAD-dependent oxidoreductase, partial [Halomonas sp. BC1]